MSKTVQFLMQQTFAPSTEYTNSSACSLSIVLTCISLTDIFQNFYDNCVSNDSPSFITIWQSAGDLKVRSM
jgi:hypothetical protein